MMNAHLFSEFSGLMLLANEGRLLAFLGCAMALFGVFLLARPLFRRLPMGDVPDGADNPGGSSGGYSRQSAGRRIAASRGWRR